MNDGRTHMEFAHKTILDELLHSINPEKVLNVLDAGSGRTSLRSLLDYFQEAYVEAVVYPNDQRKISSITENITVEERYQLKKLDLCEESFIQCYDVVVAHLLLGEAEKFGHTFEELFLRLTYIRCKYLIVIDYVEDPVINLNYIENIFHTSKYRILKKVQLQTPIPYEGDNFIGKTNFGYLVTTDTSENGL